MYNLKAAIFFFEGCRFWLQNPFNKTDNTFSIIPAFKSLLFLPLQI